MADGLRLERVRPEGAGVPPRSILKMTDALNRIGFTVNSMMIVKEGKVAFEVYYRPFAAGINHHLASVSKSVTSTAVGFAVDEGLFKLDDRIVDLLPEFLDATPHEFTAAMTVRHLLTMSGAFSVFKDPLTDDWTREFLNAAPDRHPGATFTYDTSGTHTLCQIVQKFVGQTVLEYLTPRLFEPLGIAGVEWEVSPTGVNRGGGGVRLTTEGMAKFGLLYLNGGIYNGRRVLPSGWAELATAGHISSVTIDGTYKPRYGFQFWRIRDGGFGCMGMGGQIIAAFPDKNVVFVSTANGLQHNYDYFALDYFCEFVLPEIAGGPAHFDDESYGKLMDFCENAEVFMPEGVMTNPTAEKISNMYFDVRENPGGYTGFKVCFGDNSGALTLYRNDSEEVIKFGMGYHAAGVLPWQKAVKDFQFFGKFSIAGEPDGWLRFRCGSAAVWVDEQTLVIKSHMTEQLQSFVITCHFGEKSVALHILPTGVFGYKWLPLTLTHVRPDARCELPVNRGRLP